MKTPLVFPTGPQEGACRACRYFLQSDVQQGSCRRFPPTSYPGPNGMIMSVWAQVVPGAWCGEYTPAVTAKA